MKCKKFCLITSAVLFESKNKSNSLFFKQAQPRLLWNNLKIEHLSSFDG